MSCFQAPDDWPGSENGVLFVGEKGNLFVGFPEDPELFPRGAFRDFDWPEFTEDNHYTQWSNAILGQDQTSCPFSYSGPLTETVLLGNVAFRSGQPVEWDSQRMQVTNHPAANDLLRRTYRAGWEVPGLG